MGSAWRDDSLSGSPVVAKTENGTQAKEEAMQAVINRNGSAEYKVAQAIEAENVSRVTKWPWHVILEVGFVVIALAAVIWSLWR